MAATETRTYAQYFVPTRGRLLDPIAIGWPVYSKQLVLLDEEGTPVRDGESGEIGVRSRYLATGYLNDLALTRERFVPEEDGTVLYRTGDRGRFGPNGCLEFLGRNDSLVKIRGYRVELLAVEAALSRHPSVRKAAVVAREETPGERLIVAYVVSNGEQSTARELRAFLRGELPEYMIPSAFVGMEALPLLPNAKVDQRALPAPDWHTREGQPRAYIQPQYPLEAQLAEIWQHVLNLKSVGIRDDFFDLGGDSIKAAQVTRRISKALNLDLPLGKLLEAPTIESLAGILRQDKLCQPWLSLVPIQPKGSKPPFFCVHDLGGGVLSYRHLAKHLDADQPFYALQQERQHGELMHHDGVEAMASKYINEIKTLQESGPYFLGGSSFGGLVAFEMAQQLCARGDEIGLLALFDTYGPGYPSDASRTTHFRRIVFRLFVRIEHHVENLSLLRIKDKIIYLVSKSIMTISRLSRVRRLRLTRSPMFTTVEVDSASDLELALEHYVPRPYRGRVTLFRAKRQPLGIITDRTMGWNRLAGGGLDIIDIPGQHGTIVLEPRVRLLASELKCFLDRKSLSGAKQ